MCKELMPVYLCRHKSPPKPSGCKCGNMETKKEVANKYCGDKCEARALERKAKEEANRDKPQDQLKRTKHVARHPLGDHSSSPSRSSASDQKKVHNKRAIDEAADNFSSIDLNSSIYSVDASDRRIKGRREAASKFSFREPSIDRLEKEHQTAERASGNPSNVSSIENKSDNPSRRQDNCNDSNKSRKESRSRNDGRSASGDASSTKMTSRSFISGQIEPTNSRESRDNSYSQDRGESSVLRKDTKASDRSVSSNASYALWFDDESRCCPGSPTEDDDIHTHIRGRVEQLRSESVRSRESSQSGSTTSRQPSRGSSASRTPPSSYQDRRYLVQEVMPSNLGPEETVSERNHRGVNKNFGEFLMELRSSSLPPAPQRTL